MKYLLLCFLLMGCSNQEILLSCDRDGCKVLRYNLTPAQCHEMKESIVNLHQVRKDKPGKVLGCLKQ